MFNWTMYFTFVLGNALGKLFYLMFFKDMPASKALPETAGYMVVFAILWYLTQRFLLKGSPW